MRKWCLWFMRLGSEERLTYRAERPEPAAWNGFYDFVEFRRPPQWMAERTKKLEEPQAPPSAEEIEISDYYRVQWLMRRHLQLLTYPEVSRALQELQPGELSVDFYSETSGAKWRISNLLAGGFLMKRVPDEV